MSKKTLKWLYYFAWLWGAVAVALLIFGIIIIFSESLFPTSPKTKAGIIINRKKIVNNMIMIQSSLQVPVS